jgi:hypothetical protein
MKPTVKMKGRAYFENGPHQMLGYCLQQAEAPVAWVSPPVPLPLNPAHV